MATPIFVTAASIAAELHQAMLAAYARVFGDHVSPRPIEHTRAVEQSGRFLNSVYEMDYRDMTRETWRRARATFDRAYGEFRDTLDNTAGVQSRDIAWFVLAPSGETFSNIDTPIPRRQLLDLHESGGVEAVLIGKDGGVKARETEDFDLNAFFGKIDQMPMRRNEMQDDKKSDD